MSLLEFLNDSSNQGFVFLVIIAVFVGIYAVIRAFKR